MPRKRKTSAKPRTTSLTVFVSSTIEDLVGYRKAAKEAAIRAEFHPVLSEHFTARQDKPPLEICRERVRGANVLVVIVGHRYGSVPEYENPNQYSFTWFECLAAEEAGIEILPFLVDPNCHDLDRWKEIERVKEAYQQKGKDAAAILQDVARNDKKLADFRNWLSDSRKNFVRKTFDTLDRLETEIFASLTAWRERHHKTAPKKRPVRRPAADPSKYLERLREATAYIDVRGLNIGSSEASRYEIERIYIPLTTTAPPKEDAGLRASGTRRRARPADHRELEMQKERHIPLQEALQHQKLVIVGDPGSGKSTFLNRVASSLCETLLGQKPKAAQQRLGLTKPFFPIHIEIARLAQHMENCRKQPGHPTVDDAPAWLLDYLAAQNAGRNWGLPRDFFQRKMERGDALLLLDGLDEAPGQSARQSISTLFENAVQDYGQCRFVVTTRPAAYTDKVRLLGFQHVSIAPLNDETIAESLRLWSEALFHRDKQSAEQHRSELLSAIRQRPEIRDMVTTPVMLTALAVVHWHERRLPEQRADLYESIINWLAEKRADRTSGMKPKSCLECLQDLALAMQQHPEGRKESVTKGWAAEALQDRFPNGSKANRISRAQDFLDEEEVDSGIIVTRNNELRYWHATFREYLAARGIAGKVDEEQYKLLVDSGTIYKPEWREVVLLLAGVLAVVQRRPGAADALVSRVLDSLGVRPNLARQAQCIGLLGSIVRDLSPLDFKPSDNRYRQTLDAVMGIFDPNKCESVPFKDRLAAAEALGQAGDPRLDENNWINIEAGSFEMRSLRKTVKLDAYQIGRYPVTVQEFQRFLDAGGYKDERWWNHKGGFGQWDGPREWQRQLAHRNRPVTRVSWFEASAYCEWLSEQLHCRVRLPTEAEWERAAAGVEGREYPWGNEEPDETRADYAYPGSPRSTTPVGLYPKGATPDGIHDLAGNVWEWVEDWYEKGVARVIRGGSWGNGASALRASDRGRFLPVNWVGVYGGFRCARDVFP